MTLPFEKIWALTSPVEGWLPREQARILHTAAASVADGRWIVEIGSGHGRSTIVLSLSKRDQVRVLAVDPFVGNESAFLAFQRNVARAGAAGKLSLFRGRSEEAALAAPAIFAAASDASLADNGSDLQGERREGDEREIGGVGLVYVDGAHDLSSVLADIEGWEPLVEEGGLVLFHDAFFRIGVTLALLERHLMNSRFRYLGSVGSLAVFRREATVPTVASVVTSLALVSRLGYFARNMVVTLAVRRKWNGLLRLIPPEESCEY